MMIGCRPKMERSLRPSRSCPGRLHSKSSVLPLELRWTLSHLQELPPLEAELQEEECPPACERLVRKDLAQDTRAAGHLWV